MLFISYNTQFLLLTCHVSMPQLQRGRERDDNKHIDVQRTMKMYVKLA